MVKIVEVQNRFLKSPRRPENNLAKTKSPVKYISANEPIADLIGDALRAGVDAD
jgi:hypothetical protein